MKINIIGTSGSGKSTLAKQVAEKLSIPHIEIDSLFWGPDWTPVEEQIFLDRLKTALDQPAWVMDGNYTKTYDLRFQQTDMIIWIDFSLARTLLQALRRAIFRIISGKELWQDTGNVETLGKLFSKDSILLWTLKTHKTNRIKYQNLMQDEHYSHIQFIHLRSSREIKQFLTELD
ncbi:P-loop NTPase family protein [Endozoicomonas numazuensis]|uniref:Adenylate kinase n=1 Tax=Endozoicomonas numazuensis TaxID=1137799 RepID=A0A081NIH7_9GAMM|nr:adenylate kinase [Endozoicomonas numazuensis]KEQ18250.1 adenylate kinase [Endozoicomonas numazuensis]